MSVFGNFLFGSKRMLVASLIFGIGLCLLLIFKGNEGGFLWFNQGFTPKLGKIASIFSLFGEWYVMLFLLTASLWISIRNFVSVVLTWLLGACFSWFFKLWLFRGLARPMEYYRTQNVKLNLVEGVDVHSYNTFPSGHTLTAFSSILLFRFIFPNLKTWQEILIVIFAIGCGLSRILMVQHWPEDVLAGMVLGLLAGYIGVFFGSRPSIKESWDLPVFRF